MGFGYEEMGVGYDKVETTFDEIDCISGGKFCTTHRAYVTYLGKYPEGKCAVMRVVESALDEQLHDLVEKCVHVEARTYKVNNVW